MRLEQLMYLIEIQHTRSLSEAAKKLHLSVQALSRSISNMEKELGFSLLVRSYKGVYLTSKAEEVVNISRRFLSELDAINKKEERILPILEGRYDLHSIYGEVNYFLLQLLTNLQKDFPKFEIQTFRHQLDVLAALILDNKVDIGMCCSCNINQRNCDIFPEQLYFTALLPCKLYALVPIHSPLAIYNSVSIKSILSYPLIFQKTRENGNPYMLELIQYFGTPKHVVIKSSSTYCQKLAAADVGIYLQLALANYFPKIPDVENIKIIPVRDDIRILYGYLARKEDIFVFPETEIVLNYIHAQAEKMS